ncbi:MAG: 3-(3-hydroxy-phenyl)propionate/3-hydroxycinnamic acid hydroxylase [Actinomycetota bacterium]
MIHTDVMILGGGPVGCFLASVLDDMGVSNVVVDRDVVPYQLPRAIVMDDEILRASHDHGFGDWLTAHTEPLQRGDFLGPNGEVVIGSDIPPLGLQGVPPVVVHYQPELDTMLRAEAERRGSVVKWGRSATKVEDLGDSVRATLDNGDVVESRWYVACDGASSWTRKTIGLTLEDLRFDQEWLVVDLELNEDATVELPLGVRQYCNTDRPFTYVKGVRRYRRWEFQVQEHEDASQLNTTEGLWNLLSNMVTPDQARIVRSAVYRFHAVVAPQMQLGNIFLAGDSAHQTPPFAGQGLNSGMRDALNLAWKMSFVKRGLLNESVLATYTEERAPHVRSTIAHAVDMGRLIDQLAGRVSHGVDVQSGYGGTRPAPHIETGVVIGEDPRVGHQFWYQPDVSEALRTNGASFVVVSAEPIVMPDPLQKLAAKNVVSLQAVGDAYALVVRPDRYVALVATSAEDFSEKSRLFTPFLSI